MMKLHLIKSKLIRNLQVWRQLLPNKSSKAKLKQILKLLQELKVETELGVDLYLSKRSDRKLKSRERGRCKLKTEVVPSKETKTSKVTAMHLSK